MAEETKLERLKRLRKKVGSVEPPKKREEGSSAERLQRLKELQRNIAKEQARAVLPEGNTVSRLYMNGTLRSWIHYVQLRTDKSTQLEHRQIAEDCARVIGQVFPLINEL